MGFMSMEEANDAMEKASKGLLSVMDLTRVIIASPEFRDLLADVLDTFQMLLKRKITEVEKQSTEALTKPIEESAERLEQQGKFSPGKKIAIFYEMIRRYF